MMFKKKTIVSEGTFETLTKIRTMLDDVDPNDFNLRDPSKCVIGIARERGIISGSPVGRHAALASLEQNGQIVDEIFFIRNMLFGLAGHTKGKKALKRAKKCVDKVIRGVKVKPCGD